MSLIEKVQLFVAQVGYDIKTGQVETGHVADLTTTEKLNLVSALNEIKVEVAAVQAAIGKIDDTKSSTSTLYSSNKIISLIDAVKQAIVAEAPETADTLKEIADLLAANENELSQLILKLNEKVSYTDSQALTTVQQSQATENIGVGNTTTNLEDLYLIASDTNTFIDPGFVRPGFVE